MESLAQVPSPGKKQQKGLYIFNAVIHDGLGKVWKNGFIHVENGVIRSLGEGIQAITTAVDMQKSEVLDAGGKHLYPGFILMNTPLGLNEIDAVRATHDMGESGAENPNAHTLPAYNTDSDLIPTIRSNGVLMAQISPRGGGIRGLSSVVQLDAWNWEDAVVKQKDGMHLAWPSRYAVKGWWAEPGNIERSKEYLTERDQLDRTFTDARMFESSLKPNVNTKLQAFSGLFSGYTTLYMHAEFGSDIVTALEFVRKHDIPKVVLVTGTQVLEVLDLIKERKIPVVVNRLHSLPVRPEDPVHLPVEVASLLKQAGVLVALDYEGGMEIMGSRNLAFLAGSAARHGISEEEALQLITINPARILGMEKSCGSLEVGKDATFFLSNGNALNMSTQKLTNAWIQGRPVSLESKQTALYMKFKKMLEEGRY